MFPTGSLQIESGSNLHEIHLVVVESETEIDGPVPAAIALLPSMSVFSRVIIKRVLKAC